jgi:hypothetical protein
MIALLFWDLSQVFYYIDFFKKSCFICFWNYIISITFSSNFAPTMESFPVWQWVEIEEVIFHRKCLLAIPKICSEFSVTRCYIHNRKNLLSFFHSFFFSFSFFLLLTSAAMHYFHFLWLDFFQLYLLTTTWL